LCAGAGGGQPAFAGVFSKAGVGPVVAELAAQALPTQYPLGAVVAYCGGMALFTICMGNAFAALMHTVRHASLGEITDTLYRVGGKYRRSM